jgi:hypothetical protein
MQRCAVPTARYTVRLTGAGDGSVEKRRREFPWC